MSEPPQVAQKEISCTNCGAPVPYLEGEAVLTCEYCGSTSMLAGFDKIVKVEAHYVLPAKVDPAGVRAVVSDWMGKGWLKAADLADKAVFNRVDGIVLPFWVVKTRAKTYWSGMNRRTRTVGSGDNKRTEEYWEPASGDFSEEYNWSVYAREDPGEFWGLDALNPGGKSVHADWGKFFLGFGMGSRSSGKSNLLEGKQSFTLEHVRGMKVQNGQITQERAERKGRDGIAALHRKAAEGKATRITDCDTSVDVRGVDLVYLPLYQVAYTYRGRPYRILVNGHAGEVITGEAPVGKWDKVVVLSIVMAILAAIFGLIAYFADVPALWAGTGVSVAIAVLYGVWTGVWRKD
jgi:DNA-directed RNA polymerase subunit RPC12/RpoP